MGIGDHLGELRVRLVKSVLSVAIIFCIAIAFAEHIINFLKEPLVQVLGTNESALHFTGPMDVLIANIKVSFFDGRSLLMSNMAIPRMEVCRTSSL